MHHVPLPPSLPAVIDTIQSDDGSTFFDVVVLKSSDCYSPHDPEHRFSPDHLEQQLDSKWPSGEGPPLILCDLERLQYTPAAGGARVNLETPEYAMPVIEALRDLRPGCSIGIDGGLSVSWARLTAKDSHGEYRHHHEWLGDAERWRACVEACDFWTVSMYRDGRSQELWEERLDQYCLLHRQAFGSRPLGIYVWHRERIGDAEQIREIWLRPARHYARMGRKCARRGCLTFAFGCERQRAWYHQAKWMFRGMRRAVAGLGIETFGQLRPATDDA